MLFGAAVMFHQVLTIHSGSNEKTGLFVTLCLVLAVAIWAHIKLGDSALHQAVFGVMVVVVGVRTFKLLGRTIADRTTRSKLLRMATWGYRKFLRFLLFGSKGCSVDASGRELQIARIKEDYMKGNDRSPLISS
jgi:Ceramidase